MFKKTLGQVERVSLPDVGMNDILAKVDTGAYRCRAHCDSARKGRDGMIRFVIAGKEYFAASRVPDKILTRSITGNEKAEYVVTTSIVVGGKRYDVDTILSNRKEMTYAVIIGRKFLYDNGFIVDVRRGIEYDVEYNSIKTQGGSKK
ncbi:ribosomal protein S6 modification protein [Alphaproteobacteria bacterium]|nr:ribosomal protein S6 modification protein [Alphaproteobacteria bacterium]